MNTTGEKSFKMKIRDMENAFKYRRIPYPKRSVELIALLAISCTFFLFMHTNKLNSRLREMEIKLQPSEFSALGLTADHHMSGQDLSKPEDINTLHGTYQYLKSTGQIHKIRSNHLNNTAISNDEIVFFNRVPKTGSVQLIQLMRDLGKVHNYEVQLDPQNGGIVPILSPLEQENMVDNIENLDADTIFVSHVNYLNFTKYDADQPIYINMVRDPVERVISWYYYIRAPWVFVPNRRRSNRKMPNPFWVNAEFVDCVKTGDKSCTYIEGSEMEGVGDHRRQTLFFCGHNEKNCIPFNSKSALEGAKHVVERSYAVVGNWEDTNITLAVLEAYIPKYFKGASQLYYAKIADTKHNNNPMKPHISEEIKNIVRKNFTREIEFYQFCRQRLHKQYIALQLEKLSSKKLH